MAGGETRWPLLRHGRPRLEHAPLQWPADLNSANFPADPYAADPGPEGELPPIDGDDDLEMPTAPRPPGRLEEAKLCKAKLPIPFPADSTDVSLRVLSNVSDLRVDGGGPGRRQRTAEQRRYLSRIGNEHIRPHPGWWGVRRRTDHRRRRARRRPARRQPHGRRPAVEPITRRTGHGRTEPQHRRWWRTRPG